MMAVPVLLLCCIRSVKQRARSAVCARGGLALSTGHGEEHQAGRPGGPSSNQGAHATPLDGAESFAGSNNAARSSSESKANLARLLNSMRVAANDGGTRLMASQRNVNEGHRKAEGSRGHRSEHEVRTAKLVAAVNKVAHSLPGKPSETESILLKQLRQHETHAEAEHRKITPNLSDIVADMKIKHTTRASHGLGQLHFDEGQINLSAHMGNSRVFQQKRLGIFHLPTDSSSSSQIDVPEPTLWDVEKERELAVIQEHRQQHSLDELIEWTSKGILWTFPIDNEQGLEEDQKVPFHEHIFLEHELEHFPKKGPIRHFMQLVLLGLSYNHALTVTQKREHVAWYRDYFKNKEALLQEAGTPI